ncbi:MAG: dihydropteroate synthase-like protein [Candidatus Syntropharchaeales archaeon]
MLLIITGKKAFEIVKRYTAGLADITVADIDVASLISPRILRNHLKKLDLSKYDLILLPGNVSSDFSRIEDEFGVKIRLGPRYAHDLPAVLERIDEVELSRTVPACRFLESDPDLIRKELLELEEMSEPAFMIDEVKIGGNSAMKVMAEIVDATSLDRDQLKKKVNYFTEEGAHIIDLGIELDASVDDVKRVLEVSQSATELPVSLDTMEPDLIRAGINSGAKLILSLDKDNIKEVGRDIAKADLPVVILSRSGLDELFETIGYARSIGIRKLIADPVLAPLGHGLTRSIHDYYHFREVDQVTPLFFGIGNVTELLDADSIGVNASFAGIGMELGVSILFAPEASRKTEGSVRELVTGSMMMRLASARQSSPKDLGIDLFVAKEKRRREGVPVLDVDPVVTVVEAPQWASDPLGYFRIAVRDGMIFVEHNLPDGKVEIISGKRAKDIAAYIAKSGRISMMDHGAYLGVELAKAELALKTKRSYVQDEEI